MFDRSREILTEVPTAEPIDDRNLVIPETVDMVFVQEEAGIVDQELPHAGIVKVKDQTTCPSIAREVEFAASFIPKLVEILFVAKKAARMVVDYVEDHGHAVQMTQINECLELVDLRHQVLQFERRPADDRPAAG